MERAITDMRASPLLGKLASDSSKLDALFNAVDFHLKDLAHRQLQPVACSLFKPAAAHEEVPAPKRRVCEALKPGFQVVHHPGSAFTAVGKDSCWHVPAKVPVPTASTDTTATEDSKDSQSCYFANSPVSSAAEAIGDPDWVVGKKRRRATLPQAGSSQAYKAAAAGQPKSGGTSCYRGVSWHEQTAKWKAQIKVNGSDINLGRHKDEEEAARAYDRAAICARGMQQAKLNFPLADYLGEVEELMSYSLPELAAKLRGVEERLQQQTSRYHGVRLNKRTMKWEAYIRISGKHVHLGCYQNESEAAQAFDQAAIVRMLCRPQAKQGLATNFPAKSYKAFLTKLGKAAPTAELPSVLTYSFEGDASLRSFELPRKYLKVLVVKCKEEETSRRRS